MVIPQDPDDFKRPLSDADLKRRFPKMEAWLRQFAAVLKSRSKPNGSWDMDGRDWCRVQGAFDHADGKYLVVVPEQRMPPPAALVGALYVPALGRKAVAMPNHKVVFCSVPSMDEGLYLVACINSTQMQLLLKSFASSTAVAPTTLSRLPIPPYNARDADVLAIVAASKAIYRAADKESEREVQQPLIDTSVQRLLTNAPALPAVAATRTRSRRVEPEPAEQYELSLDGITVTLDEST